VRRQLLGGERGDAVLAARPWLAEAPVDLVAREALRLELEAGTLTGVSLAISAHQQQRLLRAAAQIERIHGQGAAAAAVIDLVRGHWEEHTGQNARHPRPRSLGFFACVTRRLAHKIVRHDRARRRRAEAPCSG
jgi:hypothetical protein